MIPADLAALYRDYLACLNKRDWSDLDRFVQQDIHYNGSWVGLTKYRAILREDVHAIPDLRFDIDLLICQPPHVASRLRFDCMPTGMLFGLPVDGKRISFTENVFYEYRDGRIAQVWSIIDKAAIAAQL